MKTMTTNIKPYKNLTNLLTQTIACSTATALIEIVDSWKSLIDQKQYTISVFLDLLKAFDVVDHPMRLAKLRNYAFAHAIKFKWISSYLTG